MNNAAINTHVQAHIFIFLGHISSRIIGGCEGLLPCEGVLNWFLRQHCFTSNAIFVIIPSYRHTRGYEEVSHESSVFTSLMYTLVICISFLDKQLFRAFVYFPYY